MPKCKNDPNKTYIGDEPSPKGLGICAHAEKLNNKKKGKDGNMWTVTETKNGTKRWVKHKNSDKNPTNAKLNDASKGDDDFGTKMIPLKDIPKHMNKNPTLKIIYDKIMPEIQKNNIHFFIVLTPPGKNNGTDIYWIDFGPSYLIETYGEKTVNQTPRVILTVYLNDNLSVNTNKNAIMDYVLDKSQQQLVADIFIKRLPYNYDWSGNDLKVMNILYKANKSKAQKIKLNDEPDHPSLTVEFNFQQQPITLFDLNGFTSAKEFKDLDKITSKAKHIEYEYGQYDFLIEFIGIKDNEKLIKEYFRKIQKGKKLTFDKTVLKITRVNIRLYK
jgi:hypothetical protein